MGVKKSTVCTSARSSESRYTPASSLVSKPTSKLGSVGRGKRRSTESKRPGLSLAAQPAALAADVRRTGSAKALLSSRVEPDDYTPGRLRKNNASPHGARDPTTTRGAFARHGPTLVGRYNSKGYSGLRLRPV